MKSIALASLFIVIASSSIARADEVPPLSAPDAPAAEPLPPLPNAPAAAPLPAPTTAPAPPVEKNSLAYQPTDASTPAQTDADVPSETTSSSAPRAHTGFQLGLRAGWAGPFGKTAGDVAMSDAFSSQGSFTIDIGGKVHPHWFIGAYLGLGLGGASGAQEEECNNVDSCAVATFRIGAQVQYNVAPDELVNPWFGYGIGIESTSMSVRANGITDSLTAVGPEFAHLMGGIDFRLSKGFGLGPFVDFSLAQYASATVESDGRKFSDSIDDKQLHEWLQVGLRGVVLP